MRPQQNSSSKQSSSKEDDETERDDYCDVVVSECCSRCKPNMEQCHPYFKGFRRSKRFESLFHRLKQLEFWKELAIRPISREECHPNDLDLFDREEDDIQSLQERCHTVRQEMNMNLPPIETTVWDDALQAKTSLIQNAGYGLFYLPTKHPDVRDNDDHSRTGNSVGDVVIPKGTAICYYTGHIHTFQSARSMVQDKSYLMALVGEILVDPRLCPTIKARFINDPLNEDLNNCQFIPEELRAAVVTTRDIQPGEELFVSYGELYWSQQPTSGTILQS